MKVYHFLARASHLMRLAAWHAGQAETPSLPVTLPCTSVSLSGVAACLQSRDSATSGDVIEISLTNAGRASRRGGNELCWSAHYIVV